MSDADLLAAPRRAPQRHPLADRKNDCYETPDEAVHALLKVEQLPAVIWDPCCGPGAIVHVLRAAGRIVHATDLVDYGLADSSSRVDFLMEWRTPPSTEAIITRTVGSVCLGDRLLDALCSGFFGTDGKRKMQ